MAKLLKTNATLAILFVLVGVGVKELKAEGAKEWAGASISTTANSGAAMIVSTLSRNILDGVIFSSTIFNASGFVEIRDSDTANVSLIGNGKSGAIVTFFASGTPVGVNTSNGGAEHMFLIPRGIRIYKGISANAVGCAAGNSSPCYTVLYRQVED